MEFVGRISACIILFFSLVMAADNSYASKFNKDTFDFFEWENPLPRFSEMGFDIKEICDLIGQGKLIISAKGRRLNVWTGDHKGGGKIMPYDNTQIVTSLGIINKPREDVIRFLRAVKKQPQSRHQISR